MCNPSLLVVLKENVQSLGEKWSELSYLLAEKAADLDKVDEADLAETLDSLAFNPFQVSRCSHTFLHFILVALLCSVSSYFRDLYYSFLICTDNAYVRCRNLICILPSIILKKITFWILVASLKLSCSFF